MLTLLLLYQETVAYFKKVATIFFTITDKYTTKTRVFLVRFTNRFAALLTEMPHNSTEIWYRTVIQITYCAL